MQEKKYLERNGQTFKIQLFNMEILFIIYFQITRNY
jgi:hypothetical protein